MTHSNAGDDKSEKPTPDGDSVSETDWIPLDDQTDRGERGLMPLILHRLTHKVAGKQVTIAQLLAQSLLDRALDGHFGALEQILTRIDGDAKNRDSAARAQQNSVEVDAVRAERILDVLQDHRQGPPGD